MKVRLASLFCWFAILGAVSCSQGPAAPEVSRLLRTVPSRSVEIACFRNGGKALAMLLDSSSMFRQIDLGKLSDHEAVLSYDYSSTMVPLLSIDAGRSAGDTSDAVKGVMAQLGALGLHQAYSVDTVHKRASLLISPSTAAISEAQTHIRSGASIMDAPGFSDAVREADGAEGYVILRNSAAAHVLPAGFLKGKVDRKALASFISGACEWTVVNFQSYKKKDLRLRPYGISDKRCFLSVPAQLKGASGRLADVLPAGADFVVDLPLDDWKAWYSARCDWLDARSVLVKHRRACDALKSATRVAPKDWAASLNPEEIALVCWEGRSVLLIRTRSKLSGELLENAFAGYPAAIFGDIFSLEDESSCGSHRGWLLIGKKDDIAAFATAEEHDSPEVLREKGLTYAVVAPGFSVAGRPEEATINIQ
ncbi:MAG: hypothetical protein IK030_04875 [Bacteroidales bacterium]|nr:hypothetical protein [Bacteroidales bacterium]